MERLSQDIEESKSQYRRIKVTIWKSQSQDNEKVKVKIWKGQSQDTERSKSKYRRKRLKPGYASRTDKRHKTYMDQKQTCTKIVYNMTNI